MCWSLWITRKKFTIEGVFPNKPADVIFKMAIFLQQWKLLTKPADVHNMVELINKVKMSAN